VRELADGQDGPGEAPPGSTARDSPPATSGTDRSAYLPDFCEPQAVLTVVLVSTLLAIVVALAQHSARDDFLVALARTSGYLLWNGLLCALVLCKSRPWLTRHSLPVSSTIALSLIVVTVALVSEATYQLGRAWEGELGVPSGIFPREHWKFLLPNVGIAAIVGAIALRYFHIAHEWRRSIELEARARIRALQAGIQPHFLFNSMNAIAALTRTDPARAEEAIEDLSDLFRFNLADAHGQITLREELEVARAYQRIEQLRLGDRLQVNWLIGDMPTDALVPSLVMQPLLENAIGHGIESLSAGGTVTIHGRVAGETIDISVSHPMPPDRRRASSGHRIALDNIRQRLELAYPGRSAVTVDDSGDDYRVTLKFPLVLGAPGPVRPAGATG
jgi:two-component system, LytTR family, sensor histidine kinase AlgZ